MQTESSIKPTLSSNGASSADDAAEWAREEGITKEIEGEKNEKNGNKPKIRNKRRTNAHRTECIEADNTKKLKRTERGKKTLNSIKRVIKREQKSENKLKRRKERE